MPAANRDFEEKCVVLFCGLLGDPNVKTFGTPGQGQKGLDLLGRRNRDPAQPVGVQCKLRTKSDKLTESEVRQEVAAALTVAPSLTEYYIVTTAPDDVAMDLLAGTLALEQKAAGRAIDIQIWGWDTLQQKIRGDPKALNAFDPGHSPAIDALLDLGHDQSAALALVMEHMRTLSAGVDRLQGTFAVADTDPGRRSKLDAQLHVEIDGYRDLVRSGKPRTALTLMQALELRLTPDDSANVRARVRSNIGIAWLNLGDIAQAAAALAEAQAIDPEDRKIAANSFLGLAISGRETEAAAFARAALEADPADAAAAAALLAAAASSDAVGDPMAEIPEALLADKQVALNRLNWLRVRGAGGAWREPARVAAQAHPDDEVLQRFAAEAILEAALESTGPKGVSGLANADFGKTREAAEALQAIWDRVKSYENAGEEAWTSMACNLVTAWRVIGETEKARLVADQLVALAPNDPTVVGVAAQLALDDSRPRDAVRFAERLPEGPYRTLLLMTAESNAGDHAAVITIATDERRAALDSDDQADFDGILFQAQVAAGVVTNLRTAADALVATWPDHAPAYVIAAGALRATYPERSDELAAQAKRLLHIDSAFSDRVMVAQLAMGRNDLDGVIAALDGHVPTVTHSEPLTWLAWAFANAAPQPRTHSFFASLPQAVLRDPRYARLAGHAEANRGDLATAEAHLRVALAAAPEDLRSHLELAGLLERDGRRDEAAAHVLDLDEAQLKGEPRAFMRLAHTLRHLGAAARALSLGYRTAAAARDDAALLAHYPGLIFFGDSSEAVIPPAATAGPDVWFDLQGLDGESDVEGVIEPENVSGIGYSPDHPLAQALAGKAIDEEVTLATAGGQTRRYKLRSLKPKVVWLLHDIMATYAVRFPEESGLIELKVQDGDLQPVLDIVRQSSERNEAVLKAYAEMPLPLAAVAVMAGRSVLELAEYLPSAGQEVRACLGSAEERDAALAALRTARGQGVALDLLTAWTAYRLEVLPQLKAALGRLLLPRSAIDGLMELVNERELTAGQESMTVGYLNGQAVREVRTPEETASAFAALKAGLESIRTHCEILPTDGSESLRLDGDAIDRFTVAQVLDPAHLAINHTVPLLTDDLHLRQLAEQNGAPPGAWLQAALSVLLENEGITEAQYLIAVAQLAGLRHSHIWLDADSLMGLARLDDPRAVSAFHEATHYIGGEKANRHAHTVVALQFLRQLWQSDTPTAVQGRCTGRIAERLISGRDDWRDEFARLHRLLARAARPLPGLARACAYLRAWARGHFLAVDLGNGPGTYP